MPGKQSSKDSLHKRKVQEIAYASTSMMKQEIEKVVSESTAKLNQMAIPPVKRWVLEYVLGHDPTEPILRQVIEDCKVFPPMLRVLGKQRPDGTWPIPPSRKALEDAGPGPPYGWTYTTMVRNLYMLFEYWVPAGSGYITEGLEKILSWQHEKGYIKGPDLDMVPRVYYNGLVLGVMIKYGKTEDPRVDAIRDWLFSVQREDGGWNIPYIQDMKYRPEYRHMRRSEFLKLVKEGKTPAYDAGDYDHVPSCIWTTLGALRGLTVYRKYYKDKGGPESRRIAQAGDFILDRFFKRNYHPSYYQSEKNWTMLKFPTYFGSGLTALDTLVHLGYGPDDERMEKPIRWVLDSRSKDGLWHRSERPHPIDDQWITMVCLIILWHFHDMY
jgi:hypothetical protein